MKVKGGWKFFVLALVVMVVALALVVPAVGGVARVGGDGSTAAMCQNGYLCGGSLIAEITPTPVPVNPDALCQSGAACGG